MNKLIFLLPLVFFGPGVAYAEYSPVMEYDYQLEVDNIASTISQIFTNSIYTFYDLGYLTGFNDGKNTCNYDFQ